MSLPDAELWAAHQRAQEHDAEIRAREANDRAEIQRQQQEQARQQQQQRQQ